MTTTSDRIRSTGERANREGPATARVERGAGRALVSTIYVLRQLVGCLAAIVFVWLAVMLFRHAQPVALVLASVVLVLGGVGLFVRNRSLSRAD